MSDAAVIAAHSPPPAHAAERRPRDIDLYSEGNSVAEPDGSDDTITNLFGKDGFGFKDLLDIVNPLQHLPVVGTLYRALTGDELAPGSRIIGGTLFGGIGGFVSALANAVVENETGSDIGDKALALFLGDSPPQQNLAAGVPLSVAASPVPTTAAVAAETPSPPERRTVAVFAGPPRTPASPLPNVAAAGQASADRENPTEALIRARAAVPSIQRSGIAGRPLDGSAAARQGPRPAQAAAPGATLALAAASAPETAPQTTPAAGAATPSSPPADVSVLMRDALDKYEALMKRRTGPSISAEF